MAKVCRLCLQIIGDAYYSIDENATIRSRNKITILMPELELNVVAEPVLCPLCYGTLHAAYEFKCICLANEQRIIEYLKNDKQPPINLYDLLEETDSKNAIAMTDNFAINVNALEPVKKENILKPEPLEVLCEVGNVYTDSFKEGNVSINTEKSEVGKASETSVKSSMQCSKCCSEFTVLKQYRKHLMQCINYECDVCNKRFKLKSKFVRHKALHGADTEKDAQSTQKDSDQETSASSDLELDKNNQSVIKKHVSPKSERDQHNNLEIKKYESPTLKKDENNQPVTGSVKCSNCSTEFTVSKLYRKHLEKCSPYECDICNKKFMLEGRFLRHKLSHETSGKKGKGNNMRINLSSKLTQSTGEEESTKEKLDKEIGTNPEGDVGNVTEKISETSEIKLGIKCSKCRNKFMLKKDYKRHVRQCAPYQCDICNKKFMLENRFKKHKLSHSTTTEQTFLCEVCSKTFRNSYLFRQHLLLHTGLKPFKCPTCDKMFATKHHLCAHKQTHLNKIRERRHVCEICGKKFAAYVVLRRHRITHSQEKKFFCKICDKGFNIKMYLQQHMKRHVGEKPYVCDTCNSCFASKSNLAEHYRSHTGERPYKCKMCDKSFAQSSTLRVHVQCTHSDEKPFACEVCGKRFPLKGNLRAHSALHMENVEKFPCPYCEKMFHKNSYLKQHIKRHTEEPTHTCTICEKGFFTSHELKKHMRIHTGEKPFECEICHQRYSQRHNMHVHMKVHSKGS